MEEQDTAVMSKVLSYKGAIKEATTLKLIAKTLSKHLETVIKASQEFKNKVDKVVSKISTEHRSEFRNLDVVLKSCLERSVSSQTSLVEILLTTKLKLMEQHSILKREKAWLTTQQKVKNKAKDQTISNASNDFVRIKAANSESGYLKKLNKADLTLQNALDTISQRKALDIQVFKSKVELFPRTLSPHLRSLSSFMPEEANTLDKSANTLSTVRSYRQAHSGSHNYTETAIRREKQSACHSQTESTSRSLSALVPRITENQLNGLCDVEGSTRSSKARVQ